MRRSLVRIDGMELKPGDWIEVDLKQGKGVGRFSGIWENPTLGWTYSLNFFRYYKTPTAVQTLFGSVNLGTIDKTDTLEAAVKVSGPIKRSGWPPKRLVERRLRIVAGGKP